MDDPAQELINKQAPVIEPGYTFGTVTDKISSIVLTRPTSNGWFVGFGIAFLVTMGLLYAVGYLFVRGVGIWGVNIPVGWGFHCQFCLVDRNRARRNADFRDSSFIAAVLAEFHQSIRRSYDAVCCGLRRYVPGAPSWPSLAGVLA